MNALPTRIATRFRVDSTWPGPGPIAAARASQPVSAELDKTLKRGLQLTRSSAIALTRLQLALAGGDRRQAMAAIDRLHELDGELQRLAERDGADHEGPDGLRSEIADQKLALAFDKLAFASGISGPDMISPTATGEEPRAVLADEAPPPILELEPHHQLAPQDEPPLVDWRAFPEVRTTVLDRVPTRIWGLLVALLMTVILASAAIIATVG